MRKLVSMADFPFSPFTFVSHEYRCVYIKKSRLYHRWNASCWDVNEATHLRCDLSSFVRLIRIVAT